VSGRVLPKKSVCGAMMVVTPLALIDSVQPVVGLLPVLQTMESMSTEPASKA